MEQLELTFRAENQCLEATNFTPPLFVASNTVDWLVAKFDLGTNWDCWDLGAVKAIWTFTKGRKYIAILNADGVCEIPHEVLGAMTGEVKVNLVASTLEDDEVIERMTTYPLYCINVNKVAQIDGDNSVAITPSEYEQFVEDVQEYAQTAVSAKDDALQAKDDAGDYALYAKDYSESAESYRDEAKGYAEDAEEASQSILGLEATASVDANVGTPSVNVSVSEVGGNKVMDFDFHNLKGVQGETGATGADGFSPTVSVSEITGGHEVTITDAQGDHSFDVMDGNVENFYPFLPTDSASGSIASFPDGANNVPMLSLIASIDPVQDLHGQSSPYPAGGGVNRWDEEWEVGSYSATGQKVPTQGGRIRSINMTSVLPNTQYYIAKGVYILCQYDSNGDFLSFTQLGTDSSSNVGHTVTTSANTHYVTFATYANYGTTYNHDISINYPSTDTAYHPYSNICPISGRTEVKTVREGKNLFDVANAEIKKWQLVSNKFTPREDSYSAVTFTKNNDEITVVTTGTYMGICVTMPAVPYSRVFSVSPSVVSSVGAFDGYYDSATLLNQSTSSCTIPANTSVCVALRFNSVGTYTFKTQLEVGSTATTYQPYISPLTITTELGQTVYGGTLDVVSGVLTVGYAMVDLGTQAWGYNASGSTVSPYFYTNASPLGVKRLGPFGTTVHHLVCSQYGTVARNMTVFVNGTICADGNANEVTQIQIKDDRFTDATAFKNAMNGVQLCYELATPITYQLTPQEVRTLLGTNNIWSDSGDTQVTYKADIQKYIDKQISAVLNA